MEKRTIKDQDEILWGVFFNKLLQNVDANVMVTDSKTNIVFVNDRFLSFFGLKKNKILDKNWIDILISSSKKHTMKGIFEDIKNTEIIGRFDCPVIVGSLEKNLCWLIVPIKEGRTTYYMFIGREGDDPTIKSMRVHKCTDRKLKMFYKETINIIFSASMMSEPETAVHASRVMSFAVLLARKMKLEKEKIEKLKTACLLHDLGKLAVDDKILFKKGKLTSKEYDEIKKHPGWGADVVRLVYFLREIIPIMANHHENFDGTGYPNGIDGKNIPVESRILSVADIYEALTADRPYRKGYSATEAVVIMKEEKGKKLDPEITDIFLEMVEDGEFREDGFDS